MCLSIYENEKPEGKVATKDIICYKVLEVEGEGMSSARAISPYQGFHYEFGKRYDTTAVVEGNEGHWTIDEGFHSLVDLDSAKTEEDSWSDDHYIFVAVIPKGTRYWKGDFNGDGDSFASDSLIVLHRDSARSKRYLGNLPSKDPDLRARRRRK